MQLQKFLRYFGFGLLAISLLLAGYMIRERQEYDKKPDAITLVGPNLAIQNSLSKLETKDLIGFDENGNIRSFGQFYYKVLENKNTELLFSLSGVVSSVKQANLKGEKAIPNNLKIMLARKVQGGLDYEYEYIGKITFDEPKNSIRSGRFSTIIKPIKIGNDSLSALINTKQIVFQPEKPEDENIFRNTSPDIPQKVREKPAPYFWVNIDS
jgi:hypothetical protein